MAIRNRHIWLYCNCNIHFLGLRRDVEWLDICYGGCLLDGFLKLGNFHSKTFLCATYEKIKVSEYLYWNNR